MVTGILERVDEVTVGSAVWTPASIGDRVIELAAVGNFNPNGGSVLIEFETETDNEEDDGDEFEFTTTYTSINTTENTITLTNPLVVALPEGATVNVAPLTAYKVAWVITEQDNEPLECWVSHALQSHSALAVGERTIGHGEPVMVTRVGGRWTVTNVLARSSHIEADNLAGTVPDPNLVDSDLNARVTAAQNLAAIADDKADTAAGTASAANSLANTNATTLVSVLNRLTALENRVDALENP